MSNKQADDAANAFVVEEDLPDEENARRFFGFAPLERFDAMTLRPQEEKTTWRRASPSIPTVRAASQARHQLSSRVASFARATDPPGKQTRSLPPRRHADQSEAHVVAVEPLRPPDVLCRTAVVAGGVQAAARNARMVGLSGKVSRTTPRCSRACRRSRGRSARTTPPCRDGSVPAGVRRRQRESGR